MQFLTSAPYFRRGRGSTDSLTRPLRAPDMFNLFYYISVQLTANKTPKTFLNGAATALHV